MENGNLYWTYSILAAGFFLAICLVWITLYSDDNNRPVAAVPSVRLIPQADAKVADAVQMLISKLFVEENSKVERYATIEETTDKGHLFIRQAYFEIDGSGFLYEIGTEESLTVDGERFSEAVYLTLTQHYEDDNHFISLTLADHGADGVLDSAYMNNTPLSGVEARDTFQERYSEALAKTARHFVE